MPPPDPRAGVDGRGGGMGRALLAAALAQIVSHLGCGALEECTPPAAAPVAGADNRRSIPFEAEPLPGKGRGCVSTAPLDDATL